MKNLGLQLYGNTIWNANVSNSNKVVILAEENKFDNILKTLEYTGLNYCAYIYKGNAHIAVNKSDIDKIQRLPIEYGAILPSSKNNTLPKGNIIGTTSYKNISDKEYRKYDIDFAFKLAQRLSENNIPFSGRIYNSSTTITVDKSDIGALNDLVSVLQDEKSVFNREGNIYIYSNSDNISIAAKADYFDVKISNFNELESILTYLYDKINFTVVSTDDNTFTFYCDKGSKEKLQQLINTANENILASRFNLLISDYKYTDEQEKAVEAVKDLLSSKMDDENLIAAFKLIFENTSKYSSKQLALLSTEFVNTYENLNKFECVFADNSRLNDLKNQFEKEILLADVTKNRSYLPEQIDTIKELVNRDASKLILELLDYTFTADDIKSFMQEYINGNYRGLINVIAKVKHTTPFEIDALIEGGEYVPELPPVDSAILAELNNYTENHRNKINLLSNERNTIVINAFAGPGAGKTTSCLEIAEKLKKQGFVTEYVQEYAKELVWDNKLDLLNGSMENQFAILQEQLNRIDRLYGKVDFIVTDSPVLLNATYLKESNEKYVKAVQEIYSHFDNFNYFVERNVEAFETEGRIHNLEQSLQIDDELKDTLTELNLEYNTYNHSTIDNIVQDAIEYKENYSVAAQKAQLKKAQKLAEENNLPFSDKFSEGADDEIDPVIYDGSMTSEDFEKMQENLDSEHSINEEPIEQIQPLVQTQPNKLELEIGFTESGLLNDFMNENYPDKKISFALGNALLEFLDEKQHIERDIEELNVGYYDKTHFTITALINGEDYGYEGRFDIGDGKENGEGNIIHHIESYLIHLVNENPYEANEEELAEMRDYLDTAIPYFKKNSQLTADEQKILNDFKEQHPIRTIDDVEKAQDKQLAEVNEKFIEYYDTLYEQGNNTVEGYNLAIAVGDEYIQKNPIFVGQFNKLRGDIISSDREMAAFAFALADCGIIDRFVEPTVEKSAPNKRNYSSTMLEYFSIKKENSDKIVLFRIGDFYEAMGEDAIIVSKALDLNNTKRRINDNEHIDMCGIPANKLYSFTDTLVKNGYDVAIADIVDNKHQVVSNIMQQIKLSDLPEQKSSEKLSIDKSTINFENTSTSKNDNKIPTLKNGSTNSKTKNDNTHSEVNNLFDIAQQSSVDATEHLSIDEIAADVEPVIVQDNSNNHNFRITDNTLGIGTRSQRYRNNIEAIRLLKQLESENRIANPAEKEILSKYVGWGGLADVFNEKHSKYQEVKSLLTANEYSSARASTLDSFYTSNEIIDSVYKALEHIGFKGGDVLEPAMGVGNFFGRLPESMSKNSTLYGVEKDSISGRISKQLYPQANITVDGFENTAFQDDSFDVAVGNIPFGDFGVNDSKYNSQNLKIHDYFFTKTLDKVRDGGIVAFVTSKGTLDKKDSSFRKTLSEKADLLGAIRLPNNAFKSAGTEVTADIIFLQKRSAPPEKAPDWVQIGETSHGLPINNYYLKHPEMVLGELVQGNKLYGRKDDTMCIPFKNVSLSELLDEAVLNIKGEYKAVLNKTEPLKITSDEIVNPPKDLRMESYFIHNDDLYFYGNAADGYVAVVPAKEILGRKYNSKNIERAKDFIELREIVRDLLEAQQVDGNDDRIKDLQGRLNTAYDNFYKKYGLIHSQTNRIIFGLDNSYPLLSSLEEKTDKDKLIKKSDIFTQRINRPAEVIEKVDTAQEALIVSMNEKGCVDLAYMSSISDIPPENLVVKLQGEIYPVPELSSDDNIIYQTASEYLSGDIYQKLDTAKRYSRDNPIYEANCIALEKSIPTPLKAGDIDVNLGATWIDIKYYQKFMYEIFQTPKDNRVDCPPRFSWQLKGRKNIEIEYSQYTGRWNIKNASVDKSVIATKTYGTDYKNAYSILENVLNLNDPKAYKIKTDEFGKIVFDKNDNPVKVLDVEKTKLLQQKANAIRREFKNWIFKDPQRRADIVDTYNRTFNCIKPREYDGSHMTFPGMNASIELHEHQKNAIAHAIHGGNTLFAHSVGAGKTYEMIATAMESKRLGFCNKSMFCVPNHLTEQVGSDFLKLYPQANILVATKNDFTKENRQRFMAKIATGNYDAVIIGHSQLTKLPLSPERQKAVYEEQIADILEGIRELKAENGSSFQVKAMERTRKSLQKQLEKLQSKNKDNTVYFEELGIDKLFIDEAHEFKNLLSVTKLQNVSGISSRASQRATELFMKCRYLDEKTGGKGVVFATGTPISNSVTELHTMMRYLQYDFLTSHNNMQNFDNWVSSFGVQKTDYELAPAGNKFKERTRIAEYANLPELMSMFKQSADIRTSDTLDLNVPDCEMHIVNVDSTELQKDMVEELSVRADDVNQGNVDPTEDNMLKITSDGRKLGLDPRLIDPNLEDNPNTKLNVCVNNAFDIYSKTSDKKLTQIIFCDLGVPKGKKSKSNNDKENDDSKSISELDSLEETSAFCIYDDIKDKLISKGVPANEIAFIHDANTEQQKAELFAKVRSGEVRILLGSTGKMGTGTNVQDRIIAMHDLDVPWRPSDLEQRRGRMVRQGNINEKVHLYRYVTKGTFDAYSYQILEKKQKFISQVMTSKTPARRCSDIDQEALSYSEIKALCTGDERIKEKLTLENRVKELSLYKTEYTNTKYELEDKVRAYKGKREQLCNRISNIKTDIEKFKSISFDDDNVPIFKANIGGVEYTDRSEAAKALGAVVSSAKKEQNKGKALNVGDIYGFPVEVKNIGYFLSCVEATVIGAERYTVDFGVSNFVNLKKLENALLNLNKTLQEQINELNNLDADYESAKIMLAKPFEFEEELRQKTERLEVVTDELNLKAAQVKNSEVKQKQTNYFGKNFILNKKGKNQNNPDTDIQLKSANKKHDVSI